MSTDTVTVTCKVPNGLILRVFTMQDGFEQVVGGGSRKIKTAVLAADPVRIAGPSTPLNERPKVDVFGGYALTPGINAEFFAEWLKQNADHDAVRNNLIFAEPKSDSAASHAKEYVSQRSGLEPLNPEKRLQDGKMVPVDPRMPRQVEKAERP